MGDVIPEGARLVMRVQAGSKAYGLDDADSDNDERVVYLLPTRRLLEIHGPDTVPLPGPKQVHGDGTDVTACEVGHFLNECLKGNPNYLEAMFSPVTEWHYPADRLMALSVDVWGSAQVYERFTRYGRNQMTKFFNSQEQKPTARLLAPGKRERKYAIAHIRALYQLEGLLRDRVLPVYVMGSELRAELMRWRLEDVPVAEYLEAVQVREARLAEMYQRLYGTTEKVADVAKVNDVLMGIRQEYFNAV